MLNKTGPYTYQGVEFSSKEAKELYVASRTKGNSTIKTGSMSFKDVLVIIMVLFLVTCAMDALRTSRSTSAVDTTPAPLAPKVLPQEAKDSFAFLINANGKLCAKVEYLSHIQGDDYRVGCTTYRDGPGQTSYTVNMKTGEVSAR